MHKNRNARNSKEIEVIFMKENYINPEKLDNHYHQYLEELQGDNLIIYYYKEEFSFSVLSAVSTSVLHQVRG